MQYKTRAKWVPEYDDEADPVEGYIDSYVMGPDKLIYAVFVSSESHHPYAVPAHELEILPHTYEEEIDFLKQRIRGFEQDRIDRRNSPF
jgi:hypothetical protein